MRVITGTAKGRKLRTPKGMETRPTADRVKEALFNMLGNRVLNAVFLDLFAGTGSVGIEALSRGAAQAIFVEIDPGAFRVLQDNLTLTGLLYRAETYRLDYTMALDRLRNRGIVFDLVFIDPPYLKNHEKIALGLINDYSLLHEEGFVIVESSKKDQLPEQVGQLMMVRQEKYGDTLLNIYRYTLAEH